MKQGMVYDDVVGETPTTDSVFLMIDSPWLASCQPY